MLTGYNAEFRIQAQDIPACHMLWAGGLGQKRLMIPLVNSTEKFESVGIEKWAIYVILLTGLMIEKMRKHGKSTVCFLV